ncbi:DNA-formamidopyrimidine glycosylase [Fictibacillus phosphorivorans]|uniref:DNA-formamidopyrimidine glycosylase n=1 Tax=Fictibacillus phosphorivorans TaxID=1221500 RepID=UPI00203DAA54|nr:DNA-formamidopyrimidine glycosylase [Fictibacillus phosphorivorans]MCM3775355.1 DNA-formamidopyrimidine glycosylase [Fictibacillus phosphorivorans]
MPELPEVENVKNTLNQFLPGKVIKEVKIFWNNIIKHPETEEFVLRLKGQSFEEVYRRGKFLVFYLNEDSLASHLRMEGKYGLFNSEEPADKHTHVIFSFTDGTELRYRDVRKFGTMHLYPKGTEENHLPLRTLGVEPLSDSLTAGLMKKLFLKTKRNIKAALLDQTFIAGLGNIYVDEVLFQAKIHPETPANELSIHKLKKLKNAITETLAESVKHGGSTIRSYTNSMGEAGGFQLKLFVYGRKNEPCRICGNEIERMVVAGRGTHICKNCQK